MDSINGYKIIDRIYESKTSIIYRAMDKTHHVNRILKLLKKKLPEPRKILQYKNEYEKINLLDIEGVPKAYALKRILGTYLLILEDIGTVVSLDKSLPEQGVDIKTFIDVALKVTRILGQIHGNNIIHKNLNPSNIVYDSVSKRIWIIDFGLSLVYGKDMEQTGTADAIEENFPYISPEQTGRMNCSFDFRSDFYSLGITFYEMLTRTLPFHDTEPMALIHSHIAKQPMDIRKVKPLIPTPVAEIVMKLIRKAPEDRYQDSLSIINDLIKCRYQLKTFGAIHDFSVVPSHHGMRMNISRQLYGRKKEMSELLSSYKKAAHGTKEITLISGYAGVGKTKLVQEFYKTMLPENSFFASGKFDQLKKEGQNNSIISALSQVVGQISMEGESVFTQFKKKFEQALGDNAQLMVEILPDLEHILGPQPKIIPLQLMEAKNRFEYVFKNFISVLADKEHPIILFLDDLQWADEASLELLRFILLSKDIRYVYFIGAFRENEIAGNNLGQNLLNDMAGAGIKSNKIILDPLQIMDVKHLICDTFHCSGEASRSLSELVARKTRGNPFFINGFLTSMDSAGIITFDEESNSWKWDMREIRQMNIPRNIADMVTGRIQILAPEVIHTLKTAACIGNMFDIKTVSTICETPLKKIIHYINQAAREGIVTHLDSSHYFFDHDTPLPAEGAMRYKFLHDRFQEITYSLLDGREKEALHWKIGNLLLQDSTKEKIKGTAIEIVHHMNAGQRCIPDGFNIKNLVKLNYSAAKKARDRSAYRVAFTCLITAIDLLCKIDPDHKGQKTRNLCWEYDYALSLALYEEAVETAFLIADYEQMEILEKEADKHIRKLTDKVKLFEVKIQYLYMQNRLEEAIETAYSFLRQLGLRLPKYPSILHVVSEIIKTRIYLRKKNMEELAELPLITDSKALATIKILSSIGLTAFTVKPNLLPILVCKSLRLGIRHGNSPDSVFLYAGYGMILSTIKGSVNTACDFGKLAVTMLEKLNVKQVKAKTMTTVYGMIMHTKYPLKNSLLPLLDGYTSGLEYGDHQFAGTCSELYCRLSFYSGIRLDKIDRDLKVHSRTLDQLQLTLSLSFMKSVMQTVHNLQGKNKIAWKFNGPIFFYKDTQNPLVLFIAYQFHTMLLFLFEKNEMAMNCSDRARKYLDIIMSMVDLALFYFYDSLIILARLKGGNKTGGNRKEQKKRLARMTENQKKMKYYASCAPENYNHKYYLLKAEHCRVLDQFEKAENYFLLAIETADKNDYIQEEAIASELLGKFYLQNQNFHTARTYLVMARQCYVKWGAWAKVDHLEKKYGTFLSINPDRKALDHYSVLKASQAISKEIEINKLMTNLIRLILENSGGQKAYLALYSAGQLKIEAFARVEPVKVEVCQAIPIEKKETELSTSILYSAVRSGNSIILDNASENNQYRSDKYIMERKPLSVLCLPVKSENIIKGALYIENNILMGAFTKERIETLDVLLTQVVISIEKSRLYEGLKEEVRKKENAVRKITKQQALLKNMSAELSMAEERERKAIAGDLHDSVTQTLALSISKLKSINNKGLNNTSGNLSDIQKYLEQAAVDIRSLTFRLSPPVLNDFGLEAALEWLCDDINKQYGLAVILENRDKSAMKEAGETAIDLTESANITLFRIIRELVINTAKHAKAEKAVITIYKENKHLYIIVRDNGIGFDKNTALKNTDSFGLYSIYQRIAAINGGIKIVSSPGKGTEIFLDIDCTIEKKEMKNDRRKKNQHIIGG